MAESQKEREKMLEIIGTAIAVSALLVALVITWNKAY
jgi:hypothetical protein